MMHGPTNIKLKTRSQPTHRPVWQSKIGSFHLPPRQPKRILSSYSSVTPQSQPRQRTTYTVIERYTLRVTFPISGEVLIEMSLDKSPLLPQRKQFCNQKISHPYKRHLQWTICFTNTQPHVTEFWRRRVATIFTHNLSSVSYEKSKTSSKASSPHSAI